MSPQGRGIIGLPEPVLNVAVGSQMVLFSADSETVSVNRLKNSRIRKETCTRIDDFLCGPVDVYMEAFDEGRWFAESSDEFCQISRHTPPIISLYDLRFDLLM